MSNVKCGDCPHLDRSDCVPICSITKWGVDLDTPCSAAELFEDPVVRIKMLKMSRQSIVRHYDKLANGLKARLAEVEKERDVWKQAAHE